MPVQYRFRAKDWSGNTINEKITAKTRAEALELLSARSLVLLDLNEQVAYRTRLQNKAHAVLYSLGYRAYNNRDLMIFCRQFATMLRAGISMLQCLNILSGQKEIASLQKNIRSAALQVEQGSNLASALQNQEDSFPAIMINMIEAGETSGTIDVIMEKMADHFEKQHDFTQKIRSATLYPLFIVLVALTVMAVMVIFVLPQFAPILSSIGTEMPVYTRVLLSFAALARKYWLLCLVSLMILTFALAWWSKTKKGRQKFDRLRLCLPLFGKIYNQTMAARFARTLATLLSSGISLHSALKLVDKVVDNSAFTQSISRLSDALNHGQTMARPMQNDRLFPSLLTEMVRVGEETGTLDQTLTGTAKFYEREVTYVVERLSSILEPVLLLIVGLFIGMLVYSILSPMYRVFETI